MISAHFPPPVITESTAVQLGLVTEELNRSWYEANTGNVITDIQQQVRHPTVRWMRATLDGRVEASGALCSGGPPGTWRDVRSLGVNTPRRAEAADDATTLTAANELAIRRALEAAGIEFIDKNGGGPGVRLRKRHQKKC